MGISQPWLRDAWVKASSYNQTPKLEVTDQQNDLRCSVSFVTEGGLWFPLDTPAILRMNKSLPQDTLIMIMEAL